MHCWGSDDGSSSDRGQVTDAPSGEFRTVATLENTVCAVDIDGDLQCWGRPTSGIIEDVPREGGFIDVAVGWHAACALDEAGFVHCWGEDNPDGAREFDVVSDAPSGTYGSIGMGTYHGCALSAAGAIDCWGIESGRDYEDGGQVTDTPSGAFEHLSVCAGHNCAIDQSGHAVCWGDPHDDGLEYDSTDPVTDVSAGVTSTCVVHQDHEVECWGRPPVHDDNDMYDPPSGPFLDVAAGDDHHCAIDAETGDPVCWGSTGSGQSDPP